MSTAEELSVFDGAAQENAPPRQQYELLPPSVTMDNDTRRGGLCSGLWFAHDRANPDGSGKGRVEDFFDVADPFDAPGADIRLTDGSESGRIPGVHLSRSTLFLPVATGPLIRQETERGCKYIFEAVGFFSSVFERGTRRHAFLKLALSGTNATKAHQYMSLTTPAKRGGIEVALDFLTGHFHRLADELFAQQKIGQERRDAMKGARASRQMLWVPLPVAVGVSIGNNVKKSAYGGAFDIDRRTTEEARRDDGQGAYDKTVYVSRWPEWVENRPEMLVTPLERGGWLASKETRERADAMRREKDWETILNERAEFKAGLGGGGQSGESEPFARDAGERPAQSHPHQGREWRGGQEGEHAARAGSRRRVPPGARGRGPSGGR